MIWKSRPRSGACPRNEAFLEDHIEGELESGERWRLDAHLSHCGSCRGALDRARQGTLLLQKIAAPAPDPGERFTHNVMSLVRQEESRKQQERLSWQPLEAMFMRLAVSAALAVGIVISLAVWPLHTQPRATVAQTAAVERILPDTAPESVVTNDALMAAIAENHGK